MSIVSLKLKYAVAAFATVLFGTLVIMGLLAWQHRVDSRQLGSVAQNFTQEQIAKELNARAAVTARHVAESAASALQTRDNSLLARRMQRFVDDKTMTALVVRSPAGEVLYQWHRPGQAQQGAL